MADCENTALKVKVLLWKLQVHIVSSKPDFDSSKTTPIADTLLLMRSCVISISLLMKVELIWTILYTAG